MPIYERTTRDLMHDFAAERLKPNQTFEKSAAVAWFRENYPKIKSNTVAMHVEGMAANSRSRAHHPTIRAGMGWDLFYKESTNRYRLWDAERDPAPIYKGDIVAVAEMNDADPKENGIDTVLESQQEFALEADLQRYLVKNLHILEPGLKLYQDEDGDFSGVEFSAGQRFIDILAVGSDGAFVVIELKVSRGHDKAIGQLLRYMGWIKENMDSRLPVRGIIVASEITEDIRLAASLIPSVRLYQYQLSFSVKPVGPPEL